MLCCGASSCAYMHMRAYYLANLVNSLYMQPLIHLYGVQKEINKFKIYYIGLGLTESERGFGQLKVTGCPNL